MPNSLIKETSPYLLQHANNPVDWFPWGEEALLKARQEDKPIIVSIGYSACHWCHVMEHESFEDEGVAQIMNQDYINIKVDREERPDIDQIYMDAVQAMGLQGGWPLNVILTPDAKPFYGGTYFPKANWKKLLNSVTEAFNNHRLDIEKSADGFVNSIGRSEVEKYGLQHEKDTYSTEELDAAFARMKPNFDKEKGGMNRAPKFPMPSIYLFLLRYYSISKNGSALNHAKLTLDAMAQGGIYDQIGGGFARYSTDTNWFAPHFEKMLYDNGQLLSLYSEAFTLTKSELYKDIVFQTIDFLERELKSAEGGFYSALDADSEGIEGKFYVWESGEFDQVLGNLAPLFRLYYNVETDGNWEHNYNILYTTQSDEEFTKANFLNLEDFKAKKEQAIQLLFEARKPRIRPGLDDKCLTSWNGLLLTGLSKAYIAFGEEKFLTLALDNANFINSKLRHGNSLWHNYKNGKANISGYLEDYATVIEGFISLYNATFNEKWLQDASALTEEVITHFYDEKEKLFFFTSNTSEKLIARKKEIFDNVIPASNSIMANNLFDLGHLLENENYKSLAKMMSNITNKIVNVDLQYSSNWACLYAKNISTPIEIAIIGSEYQEYVKKIRQHYLPHVMIVATESESNLPLTQHRTAIDGKTTIYVCQNKTCQLPVFSVEEALKLIGV